MPDSNEREGPCSRRSVLGATAVAAAAAVAGCGTREASTTEWTDAAEDATASKTGSTASTTGESAASARSVANVTAPRFGATGDGETDDTVAIRAAAAAAAPDGTLYFPPGEYRVSGAIDLGGASVDGAGRHAATVRAIAGGDWQLGIAAPGGDESVFWAENADRWSARHVGIDANGENASCVTNYGGSWVALTNLHAENSDDSGVQHWGGAGAETNACRHCLTAHNSVRNCRWNLVFDGDVANANMLGNVSHAGGARHVSLDNRTFNDRDMRAVTVANNALRGHGDQAAAEHAIYVRGGRARDAQRSTDGTVAARVANNWVRNWPGVGVETRRARGTVAGNTFEYVPDADANAFATCLVVDEHRDGLAIAENSAFVGPESTVLDHAAATPGRTLRVTGNRTPTADPTFYASDATDDAWTFAENYAGATEVTPG